MTVTLLQAWKSLHPVRWQAAASIASTSVMKRGLSSSSSSTLDISHLELMNAQLNQNNVVLATGGGFLTENLAVKFPYKDQHVAVMKPKLTNDFKLQSGVMLPKESIQIKYATFGTPDRNKPIILLCPSMSNSVFAMDQEPPENEKNTVGKMARGWWRGVVGKGEGYGIDINKYFVICSAPLGSPFGSTAPVTPKNVDDNADKEIWGPTFPQITPRDQAALHAVLLESLGIDKVYAVVGGSMGGMQSIQFAVNFPEKYSLFVAIAATAQTSPGIVALRSVQRAAVKMDTEYNGGYYYMKNSPGPKEGMRVARMFGTIGYRSHAEFVERFDWYPTKKEIRKSKGEFELLDVDYQFDVERYLNHQADIFVERSRYDANCWLLNSKSMDLMDIGCGVRGYEDAVKRIPSTKQGMLLSYSTDRLTPAEDLERFSTNLGKNNIANHFEVLDSKYGHDAFLIEREAGELNLRLKAFLEVPNQMTTTKQAQMERKRSRAHNVHNVQKLYKELFHN